MAVIETGKRANSRLVPSELGDRPDLRAIQHAVTLEAQAHALHFDEVMDRELRSGRAATLLAAAEFLRNAASRLKIADA